MKIAVFATLNTPLFAKSLKYRENQARHGAQKPQYPRKRWQTLVRKVMIMTDLRFESSDGEYLLLEGADGTSYRLLIDDGVRRAIRRDVVTDADAAKISPREIQLEIRAGVTIEDIVAKTGASFEYVEKFAAPVIDELAHITSSALSVRITMAGDRYSETTQVEFGDVIANRLAAAGVVSYNWTVRKSDNGGWQLHCNYGDKIATWAFDPRKLALTPENENAVSLSTQQSLTDGPIPKLRPVVVTDHIEGPTASQPTEVISPPAVNPASETPSISPVLRSVAPVAETPASATPAVSPEPITQAPAAAPSTPTNEAPPLRETAVLLDALRNKRRLEREGAVETPEPATSGFIAPSFDDDTFQDEATQESAYEDELSQEIDAEVTITAPVTVIHDNYTDADTQAIELPVEEDVVEDTKPKKPGRTSMPSWDQIVFSTKPEDEF
jgi:hypothetical protein